VLVTIAVLFLTFLASTPQQAALHALYAPKGHEIIVTRTDVVGRYATVLTRGGLMEGSAVTEPILVERFSFGWQALDILYFRCRLDAHSISGGDNARLMLGMPKPYDDRPCRGGWNDAGSIADVEAVRRQMGGRLTPYVVISGIYAVGGWYGSGGGETLFRKDGAIWRRIAGGGGEMGVDEMREYGVPQSAWCAFGIYGATCPHKN
jgi:hypothetical protein